MSTLLNHPMIINESWEKFTSDDHKTWSILFNRQSKLLENCAVQEFVDGIKHLSIANEKIPTFKSINKILNDTTNFSIISVAGFIPEALFFSFLAERKFPSTCFIRSFEQLDYLEKPDIFHDVFGHVPLLVNPIFADFMQLFGKKGLEAINYGCLELAAALYWFTVEFGLINTNHGIRIYGAGIVSSKEESLYSITPQIPTRKKFNLEEVIKTKYRTDSLQKDYFVIEDFEELFIALNNLDWKNFRL